MKYPLAEWHSHMRTIGYCERCRKAKNVTISPNNLMRNHLIGICDDCAADDEPLTGRTARDCIDSAQSPDHSVR